MIKYRLCPLVIIFKRRCQSLLEVALLPPGKGSGVHHILCFSLSTLYSPLASYPFPAAGDQRSPPQDSDQHSEAQGEAEPAALPGEGEWLLARTRTHQCSPSPQDKIMSY